MKVVRRWFAAPLVLGVSCVVCSTASGAAPPVLGQSADVAPVSGKTYVTLPGQARTLLTSTQAVPMGTIVDSSSGTAEVTVAHGPGADTRSGQFGDGAFVLSQSSAPGANGEIELTGGSFADCSQVGPDYHHRRKIRAQVTRGGFVTVGRFDAAVGIGNAAWEITDECDATQVARKSGIVDPASTDFSTLTRLRSPKPLPQLYLPMMSPKRHTATYRASCTPAIPVNNRYQACVSLFSWPDFGLVGMRISTRRHDALGRLCVARVGRTGACRHYFMLPGRHGVETAKASCLGLGTGRYVARWFVGSRELGLPLPFVIRGTGPLWGSPCGAESTTNPMQRTPQGTDVGLHLSSGDVVVHAPHARPFRLRGTTRVPPGTTVDARHGSAFVEVFAGAFGSAATIAKVSGGPFAIRAPKWIPSGSGAPPLPQPVTVFVLKQPEATACASPTSIVAAMTVTDEAGGFSTHGSAAQAGPPIFGDATWTTQDECDGTRVLVEGGPFTGPLDVANRFETTNGVSPGNTSLNSCGPVPQAPTFCTAVDTYAKRKVDLGLGVSAAAPSRYKLCLGGSRAGCSSFPLTAVSAGQASWTRCTIGPALTPSSARWIFAGAQIGASLGFHAHGAPHGTTSCRAVGRDGVTSAPGGSGSGRPKVLPPPPPPPGGPPSGPPTVGPPGGP